MVTDGGKRILIAQLTGGSTGNALTDVNGNSPYSFTQDNAAMNATTSISYDANGIYIVASSDADVDPAAYKMSNTISLTRLTATRSTVASGSLVYTFVCRNDSGSAQTIRSIGLYIESYVNNGVSFYLAGISVPERTVQAGETFTYSFELVLG